MTNKNKNKNKSKKQQSQRWTGTTAGLEGGLAGVGQDTPGTQGVAVETSQGYGKARPQD